MAKKKVNDKVNVTDERKNGFLEALERTGGIIAPACQNCGISRQTFYHWRDTDAAFATRVQDIIEAQMDYVESQLMSRIAAGDTTATIFYLKTRGKNRGWTEKQPPVVEISTHRSEETPTVVDVGANMEVKKRIKGKKDYIIKLLKKEGKYTAELSMQVTITAQLLVQTDMLAESVMAMGSNIIDVEYSREGNERKSVNPMVKLYNETAEKAQRALRALGMNVDAKERKSDNDSFGEFMKEFSRDDD